MEDVSSLTLDHLGLVASTIKDLGLIEKLDSRLPLSEGKMKTSMGERVAAMILNGLGFIDDRLYMFPKFLENKPVDRLFGRDIKAEYFNDDALGRCLDEISAYGGTRLFSEVAFEIGIEQNLLGRSAHFDTSSISLYGAYDEADAESNESEPQDGVSPAAPRYGYSKDHRPDLKQMIINLATTGASGFPIWMESHSGNASDQKVLMSAAKRMQDFCMALKEAPSFMLVGDSAIYDSCLKEGGKMLWLTRVPEKHKIAKELVQSPDASFNWQELKEGYRYSVLEHVYKNVQQRWIVVFSEHAYKREIQTLDRAIAKAEEVSKKALWHLGNQVFQCEKDAEKALKIYQKTLNYHTATARVKPIKKQEGRGRPSKGACLVTTGYQIQGTLHINEEKITLLRQCKGRFILATNQLDRGVLSDADILAEYKKQSKTESGFKFIKDDTFEVASIFLKKSTRISALMMVMTLCLMVYALAQHRLRKKLQEAEDTLPNQSNKPTESPSMKWVYRLFQGVHIMVFTLDGQRKNIVTNIDPLRQKIIRHFGTHAMAIYGVT